MRFGRRAVIRVIVGIIVSVGGGGTAWATLENFKTFKQTYPGKDAKYYSCKVCHLGVMGKKGDLNPYGLALQQSTAPAPAKALTVEHFKAIEKDDADGDGASNLDEITAGTLPGDPASVPPGVKPKAQAPSAGAAATSNKEAKP